MVRAMVAVEVSPAAIVVGKSVTVMTPLVRMLTAYHASPNVL